MDVLFHNASQLGKLTLQQLSTPALLYLIEPCGLSCHSMPSYRDTGGRMVRLLRLIVQPALVNYTFPPTHLRLHPRFM
jgi:hypothetical protein